jgi:hypothetical protein
VGDGALDGLTILEQIDHVVDANAGVLNGRFGIRSSVFNLPILFPS